MRREPGGPMANVAAVLLAAGLSRRMGAVNKLLLPVGGEPMARRCARALTGSAATSVTVVLGHDADAVAEALAGLGVRFVRHRAYADGQTSSIRAGLAAAPEAAGYLMALADQPTLGAAGIDAVLAAAAAQPDMVTVPTYRGARGNPVVMPADARRAIAAQPADYGCRAFMRDHPARVRFVELDLPAVVHDVDTPDAYAGL